MPPIVENCVGASTHPTPQKHRQPETPFFRLPETYPIPITKLFSQPKCHNRAPFNHSLNLSKMTTPPLIQTLPKAELHVHIEGTFEPELMFQIAQRNSVSIPYANVDEVRAAYDFHNLQSFLDIY